MRFTIRHLSLVAAAVGLAGCPRPETATEKKSEKPTVIVAPRTATGTIQEVHSALEANCGRDLDEIDLSGLRDLELYDDEVPQADALLAEIGLYAQQCATFSSSPQEAQAGCNPDCHWCPIKWYWCIENAGACVGGDNKSCCKLGACGSKHHCKEVCKSSCGCDVPPLPSDGGGDGGDE